MKISARSLRRLALAALAAGTLAAAPHARADMIGFTTAGGNVASYRNFTVGYTFTLANAVSVTQLGFWDYQADGLSNAVPVTIWKSGGTALATATLPAGTTTGEINQYLYVTLATPVTLAAGTYTIGGFTSSSSDAYQYNVGAVTAATGITYNQEVAATGNNYPTHDILALGGNSYFGPNFQFTAVAPAGGMPEPSTWAALAVGGALLAGVTLRRRAVRPA